MVRQYMQSQIFRQILVDIGEDLIHLFMVGGSGRRIVFLLAAAAEETSGQKDHQFHKGCLVEKVLAEFSALAELVDVIEKAFLLLLREGEPVAEPAAAAGKTVV